MSQIELGLQALLNREPEIEKCSRKGIVNRRALARYLIARGVAGRDQVDALVATLRRHDFGSPEPSARPLTSEMRMALKDRIVVLSFEKDKELLHRLERVIAEIDYDRGDTLKIVVGTSTIKLFVDEARERALLPLLSRFRLCERLEHLSEISLVFPAEASRTRGLLAWVTRELSLADVVVAELLTASPELLLYLEEAYVPRAYETLRRLQGSTRAGPKPSAV